MDIERSASLDVVGNGRALPFTDSSIDTIILSAVLEHIPIHDVPAVLSENGGVVTDVTVTGVRAWDDQGTKTQLYGVHQGGDYNLYDGNNLRGNKNGAYGGTVGTNSVKGDNITS